MYKTNFGENSNFEEIINYLIFIVSSKLNIFSDLV